eukprot:6011960-Amphidinium_carterae.1
MPPQLFARCHDRNGRKLVDASEVLHEGIIPPFASRMTMSDIMLSFGHGLRGLMPSFPGTVSFLSSPQNGLQGRLPELHITDSSSLFLHANEFSCRLPRFQNVKPNASLALIGNHFSVPHRQLPAWITSAERPSDMFCVSNVQGITFVIVLVCAVSSFLLVAFAHKSFGRRQPLRPLLEQFARARSAWYETIQRQALLAWASCMVLGLYINMVPLTCTIVSEHLRFHFVASGGLAEACLVAGVHVWICKSAACFHHRHATRTKRRCWAPRSHARSTSSTVFGAIELRTVHLAWFLLCAFTAAPGVLYSTVKDVPGFLEMSDFSRSFISSVVGLLSGFVTGLGLPLLRKQLWNAYNVDHAMLQLVGLVLASILLPCLVP